MIFDGWAVIQSFVGSTEIKGTDSGSIPLGTSNRCPGNFIGIFLCTFQVKPELQAVST
jgi:hypothetical protein